VRALGGLSGMSSEISVERGMLLVEPILGVSLVFWMSPDGSIRIKRLSSVRGQVTHPL